MSTTRNDPTDPAPLTTADIRRAAHARVSGALAHRARGIIYRAMRQVDRPLTTVEIAAISGIRLLTTRPRVHELGLAALVVLSGRRGREGGLYLAVPVADAAATVAQRMAALAAAGQQLDLFAPPRSTTA